MSGLLQYLTCPITGLIFDDPVKANDGHTYERSAIEEWFADHSTSPMTGNPIKDKTLIEDFNMRSIITKYIQDNPDQLKNKFKSEECEIPNLVSIITSGKLQDLLKYGKFKLTETVYNNKSLMEYLSRIMAIDIFKHVYIHSPDRRSIDENGYYLIHYVCRYSSLEIIKYLISDGHSVDAKTKDGKMPLHFACERTDDVNDEIASYLINKGSSVDAVYFNPVISGECTPLCNAIIAGRITLVYRLWNNSKEFGHRRDRAIHLLAEYMPNEALTRLKYMFLPDLLSRNFKSETIVHIIFRYGHKQTIVELLWYLYNSPGLRPYIDDIDGGRTSPIMNLVERFPDDNDIWDILFQQNINLVKKQWNDNDLGKLISNTKNSVIMEQIIQYIKKNDCYAAKGYVGYAPIFYMIYNRKPDWMIKRYFEVIGYHNILTDNHDSIMTSVIWYTPHLIDFVLGYVLDLNVPNKQGVYPIHHAVRYCGIKYVDKFVAKGANLNVRTNLGKSVLAFMIEYDFNNVIEFLDKYPNIDRNIKYNDGSSPFYDMYSHRITDDFCEKMETMVSRGVNLKFDGRFNLVFKLISCNREPTDQLKRLIKTIGLDGLDFDMPIMIAGQRYTVNERLDYYLGIWYY
jgi:ankyrin repeat protein